MKALTGMWVRGYLEGLVSGHCKTKFSAQRRFICPRRTKDRHKGQRQEIEKEGEEDRNKGEGRKGQGKGEGVFV